MPDEGHDVDDRVDLAALFTVDNFNDGTRFDIDDTGIYRVRAADQPDRADNDLLDAEHFPKLDGAFHIRTAGALKFESIEDLFHLRTL